MITVKVVKRYDGNKPKWWDKYIGKKFSCTAKVTDAGTIFFLTDEALKKLSKLKGSKSYSALIYPPYCEILRVGNIKVKQL